MTIALQSLLRIVATLLLAAAITHAQAGDADITVQRDIAYGNHQRQVLDVHAPPDAANAPVIVMVHGGGWRHGDKGMKRVVDNKVARWVPRGFLFVSINYRLMPETDPRRQADDVAAAVKFVRNNAARWGGDSQRIVLMGHSAGAHLIALLTAAPTQFGFVGDEWLGAVSLDSGAIDVEKIMTSKHPRLYDKAFGDDRKLWQAASPMRQLEAAGPPMLLVCSSKRRDQPCVVTAQFAEQARRHGRRAEMLPQPLGHGEINDELGENPIYTAAVEKFLGSLDTVIAQRLAGNSTPR